MITETAALVRARCGWEYRFESDHRDGEELRVVPIDTGHRVLPHTADIRIEAWAPTRDRCLSEAVVAMVESFVDLGDAEQVDVAHFRVDETADEDMLVDILDEVIYLMDTADVIPLGADFVRAGEGLDARFRVTSIDQVELVGAVPKAVSLHELQFDRGDTGWVCSVILDV